MNGRKKHHFHLYPNNKSKCDIDTIGPGPIHVRIEIEKLCKFIDLKVVVVLSLTIEQVSMTFKTAAGAYPSQRCKSILAKSR